MPGEYPVRDDARRPRDHFATTHWSVVLAAGAAEASTSKAALAALCELYWYPLYAYARRDGRSAEDAEDLVQAFFVRLLEKQSLRNARAECGRFRSFLLGSLKHFMINDYHHAHAAKRGGGARPIALDTSSAEGRYAFEPRDDETPERVFERRWAQTVIDRAQVRLRASFIRAGKVALFERLKDFAIGGDDDLPIQGLAASLAMSDGAVRVAIHRLRRRFHQLLREEVQQTVDGDAEVEEELRFLVAAVTPPRSGGRSAG